MIVDLSVESEPDPQQIDYIERQIRQEAVVSSGFHDDRHLAVMARQEGRLVGGCFGGTWGGTCELESLWVAPELRRGGLGSRLLTEAEAEASRRGCHQVVLLTHETQAPGFYEHRGYEIVGRVDDYPSGSAAHWFRKRLSRRARRDTSSPPSPS